MWLLPYEQLYICTRLPYNELHKKLLHIADASKKFRLFEPFFPQKTYYGRVTQDGFRVHRWIDFSRSYNPYNQGNKYSVPLMLFPPVITGDFLDAKNGEIIVRIRFYLHWTALIALFSWLLLYGFIFALLIVSLFPNPTLWSAAFGVIASLTFLVLTLICTYGTMLALFKSKVEYEKKFFRELTESYESIETG